LPDLTNSQEPDPEPRPVGAGFFFGSLEPKPELLEKKPGTGAAWEKNQEPEPEPLAKKSQEPEPLKNLPAPQPWINI
jgi:hypothetical protein